MSGWLYWLVGGGLLLYAIIIYNGFVSLRARAEAAWSDIDVQLKRRHNLIPNLVDTVKAYATHERQTLEQVTRARQQAIATQGIASLGPAEAQLSGALQHLFAVVEAYPDLKANGNFLDLQRQLVETEEAIQNARRYYNAVVRDYNTKVGSFPDLLVARPLAFGLRDYFQLDSADERRVPEIAL